MNHCAPLCSFVVLWLNACSAPANEGFTDRDTRAVRGGAEALPGSMPWQARLTLDGSHQCSGALVAKNWVLTAGHCVAGVDPASVDIVLGDYSSSEAEETEQWRTLADVVLYPGWGSDSGLVVDDDLALLRLDREVDSSDAVQVIQLSDGAIPCAAQVFGWGELTYGGGPSDVPQRAELGIAPAAVCQAHLKQLDEPEASDTLLCAGAANGSIGTCHGDSGAPLVAPQSGQTRLLGITVNGGPECDEYSLFAAVNHYASWIASTLNQ